MNFESFKNLVNSVRQKNPIWFSMVGDRPPTKKIITEAELRLGVVLPGEYKAFLSEYGGGYFAFANIYSLDSSSDWELIKLNNRYKFGKDRFLLISENGLGDFYGFRYVSGACESEIYFFDHELGEWEKTQFANLFDLLGVIALSH